MAADSIRATEDRAPRSFMHELLSPVPIVCFIGALFTDLAYLGSADIQWANFSAWLLFVGIIFGVLAAIAGIMDNAGHHRSGGQANWVHSVGYIVVLVLAFFNNLVHARDAWTSVVPTGLILSALTVLAIILTEAFGHTRVGAHAYTGEDRRSAGRQADWDGPERRRAGDVETVS